MAHLGWLVLPRGLIGQGTTSWICYFHSDYGRYRLTPTEIRFEFSPVSLFQNLSILRLAYRLWLPRFQGVAVRRPVATEKAWFEGRIRAASVSEEVFPLRTFLYQVDLLAATLGLDPTRSPKRLYLDDIFENGLCVLLIEPRPT